MEFNELNLADQEVVSAKNKLTLLYQDHDRVRKLVMGCESEVGRLSIQIDDKGKVIADLEKREADLTSLIAEKLKNLSTLENDYNQAVETLRNTRSESSSLRDAAILDRKSAEEALRVATTIHENAEREQSLIAVDRVEVDRKKGLLQEILLKL